MVATVLIIEYAVLDLILPIFSLALFGPSENLKDSILANLKSVNGYHYATSPVDYIVISILRVTFLTIAVIFIFLKRRHYVRKLSWPILIFSISSYSYSLIKLLVLSENDKVLSYTGLWISVVWSILSSNLCYYIWTDLSCDNNSYETLENEEESSQNSEESDDGEHSSVKESLKLIIKECKEQWRWFAPGFILLFIHSIARIYIPYMIGKIVDDIVNKRGSAALLQSVATMAIIAFISAFVSGLRQGTFDYATGKLNRQIRSKLFRSLVRQEVAFFDSVNSGDMMSRLSSDCTKITQTMSSNMNVFVRDLVMVIGTAVLMFLFSWRLALVIFIAIPPLGVLITVYGKWFADVEERVQDTISNTNQISDAVISSFRTVRSFACEELESKRFDRSSDETVKAYKTQAVAFAGYYWSNELWETAVLVSTLFYGGHLVLTGKLTSGSLITFMLYQIRLGEHLFNVFSEYTLLMGTVGASRKVFKYMHRIPTMLSEGSERHNIEGTIVLENIHFSYPSRPNEPILKGLDLKIESGKSLALVGPSGGGKTSIVSLIQRFYQPSQGQITLDGVRLDDISHEFLHQKIALVAQEPVLYSGSIRDNILFGCDWATEEDMLNAARMANVHDFVQQFEKGYDTECGEKGLQMSGGQKQRIAIARALVRRPSVLVLDEATSALDAESEALVQEAINSCTQDRTVIIIAHRLSTIENADKIAVMENGQVVQLGTHKELLDEVDGLYQSLLAKQTMLM